MIVIARELIQYEKNYIKCCINIPKIYSQENNIDFITNEMIRGINQLIFEDILIFMDIFEDSYNPTREKYAMINCITEFQVGYVSEDIISLAIEFSQLSGVRDISYIKGYNYDLKLKREINLKDIFKENINYLNILKKYIVIQRKIFLMELQEHEENELENKIEENIYLDEENIFYFTHEFLILPFSSCEIDGDIFNLLEFKIPFNKIYPYLNEYAIKNIVKKIIL